MARKIRAGERVSKGWYVFTYAGDKQTEREAKSK